MLTIITIWIVKMRMCMWTEFALMATRGELHRFVYWPQCIYSGDPILLSQFVLVTMHLQWRFHSTVPRSALLPEVSHDG